MILTVFLEFTKFLKPLGTTVSIDNVVDVEPASDGLSERDFTMVEVKGGVSLSLL
jgi:hypothetical protein